MAGRVEGKFARVCLLFPPHFKTISVHDRSNPRGEQESNKKQCSRQLQCEVPCTVQQPLQVTILLKWAWGNFLGDSAIIIELELSG